MKIKMFLFDFGGVISPEGFQIGLLKIAQEIGRDFEVVREIAVNKAGLATGYFAGKAAENDFWDALSEGLGLDYSLKPLRYHFIDNFITRSQVTRLIKGLSHFYTVALFSDQTNWIYEVDTVYPFLHIFDHKFISCNSGYTKLDDKFYRLPEEKTGIPPKETMLIDDKDSVLAKANKLGFNTHKFTSVADFKEFIVKERLLP